MVLITHGWLIHRLCITLFPALLLLFSLIPEKRLRPKILFDWLMWTAPFIFIACVSLTIWRFDPELNFLTYPVLAFHWQWSAIFEWALLFILMVFYSRTKIHSIDAVTLSWASFLLGSILYEIPWHIRFMRLEFLYYAKFHLGIVMTLLVLKRYHYKFNLFTLAGLIIMVVGWIIYPPYGLFHVLPPGSYWIPRLTVFPLFLSLPYGVNLNANTR